MLVTIPLDGEERVYKRLRESEFYKGNFGKEYYQRYSEMNKVVEAAKMYIIDNYQKISDWTELHFKLCGYGEDRGTVRFGMKDEERKRRYPPKPRSESKSRLRRLAEEHTSPHIEEMLKRIDDEKIQVESFEAVYDWTDGDFSVTVNGKLYMWIDHHNPDAVIEIAHFIEKQLNNGEQPS